MEHIKTSWSPEWEIVVHVSSAEFTVTLTVILSDEAVVINQDFIRVERQSGNALSELTRSLNGLIFSLTKESKICE